MADPTQQIAALTKRLDEMQNALNLKDSEMQYLLRNLSMKRMWEKDREDNLDATHPLVLRTWIPPKTKVINNALLNLNMLNFRSYGAATDQYVGGAVWSASTSVVWSTATIDPFAITTYGGGHGHEGTAGSAGAHTHGGAVPEDGAHPHFVVTDYENDHIHQLPYHSHLVSIPAHLHQMVHGIYEGTGPTNVGILINGVSRTAALGGPWNADTYSLDIRQYLAIGQLNTITITSASLGRVAASMNIEIYLP